MLDYAINNEMTEGVNLPPFLTTNPSIGEMSVMAETSIPFINSEGQLVKECNKCGETRPIGDFHKRPERPSGVKSRCKFCLSEYNKAYLNINKEQIKARKRKYVRCNRDAIAEYNKQYYQDHEAERILYTKNNKEARAKKYQENKKEVSTSQKLYRQEHKDIIAEGERRYRQTEAGKNARRKAGHKWRALKVGVDFEKFNPMEVFDRDGYRCQLCGKKTRPDYSRYHSLYPHLDHIIPLSLGGPHTRVNTQCLCLKCNVMKHNTGKGDQLRMFG